MAIIKTKNSNGEWVDVASADLIEIIMPTNPSGDKEWREIEVTGDEDGIFDCSSAGINLLETEDWIFFGNGNGSDFGSYSFYAVAAGSSIPFVISPIIARLKGEDMSSNFKRIGLYTFPGGGYGFGSGLGSDFLTHRNYVTAMGSGTSTSNYLRVYSDYLYLKNSSNQTFNSVAKLIYLADKEA